MTTTTTQRGAGRQLAERLGLKIIGDEGHDLKCACVVCESSHAGRVHQDTGVYYCYSCQKALSAFDLCKVTLGDHQAAIEAMVAVGLFAPSTSDGNGHATTRRGIGKASATMTDEECYFEVCRLKRMPPDSCKKYGGEPYKGGVRIPMWGPDLKRCSAIHITPENGKGMYFEGKPVGLFLPNRSPDPGERWLIVEGPKDAAALHKLGHLVAGLPGNQLPGKQMKADSAPPSKGVKADFTKADFASLFKGVDVIILADGDKAGKEGAAATAKLLQGVARTVRVGTFPDGKDARDVLAEQGPEGIGRMIQNATEGGDADTEGIDFGIITAAELLRKDCSVEFLIPHVLAKDQHHILGGPLKCCKSLIATDLAVSLSMGGRFLDHFEVTRPVRTILLCGEAGWPVFQENIRRISGARGATEEHLENLLTGVRLPKFGNVGHQDSLGGYITEQKAEVVIIDCAYRCIPGESVSNQFMMGEVLDSIGHALESVGATLILLCHTPKHIAAGDPLELDNLAFAGFSEFAAQWLIVNRQKAYEPGTGRHNLWAVIGGRAGHSGTYALDLDEGEFHQGKDREWRTAVTRADKAREEYRGRKEQEREAKRAEKLEEIKKRILNAAATYKQGETATTIRDRAGLHDREFKPALSELLDSSDLLPIEIVKSNRKAPYSGYILASYQTT